MFYIQKIINIGGEADPIEWEFIYAEGKCAWIRVLTFFKEFLTEQEALDKIKPQTVNYKMCLSVFCYSYWIYLIGSF